MRSQQSPSGLWNRQSSVASEEATTTTSTENAAGNNNNNDVELAAGSVVPLLQQRSESSGAAETESPASTNGESPFFIYGHMALSFLFLLAGASIVPLFAAAENEAWRSQNIPYQKTNSGDVLLDLRLNKPLVDPPTISSRLLIVTAVVVPLVFVVCFHLFQNSFPDCKPPRTRSQLHELRASVCALLVSVGLSESVTCTLKLYVSRHRPNFYQLCGFDPQTLQCMAPLSQVHEASLSFPSGHSSLSFCGMTFLIYFLRGRLDLLTPSSSVAVAGKVIQLMPFKSLLGVLCVLGPWSYSFFVACSRIVDHWHHPDDVVAGTLLGIAAATVGYHAFYPPSSSAGALKAGIPLSLQ